MTENENNKVPYSVFNTSNELLHSRINKLTEDMRNQNYNIQKEIAEMRVYMKNTQDNQEKFYQEQKETNKHLSRLIDTMTEYSKELIHVKRDIKETNEDVIGIKENFNKEILGIQEELKGRKNYNIAIVGAAITGVTGIIIAAINIAPILFSAGGH